MTEADRRPRAAWIGGAAAPATRTGVLWAGLRADAVWVGAAKVLGGAMFVAVNLWAARHLDPAAFGVFALSITSLLLVDNICGSALDLAVVRLSGDAGTELGHGLSPAERAAIVLKVGAGTVLFVLVMLFGEGLGGLVFQA